jgi:hypothetical protein
VKTSQALRCQGTATVKLDYRREPICERGESWRWRI